MQKYKKLKAWTEMLNMGSQISGRGDVKRG